MYDANVAYPEDSKAKIWFYFKDNGTMVVDGSGVAAEVVEADIGALNGVVHVIDKVLGVPSQSIYDTISQDPMMS